MNTYNSSHISKTSSLPGNSVNIACNTMLIDSVNNDFDTTTLANYSVIK